MLLHNDNYSTLHHIYIYRNLNPNRLSDGERIKANEICVASNSYVATQIHGISPYPDSLSYCRT
jgi:hypothetical protein